MICRIEETLHPEMRNHRNIVQLSQHWSKTLVACIHGTQTGIRTQEELWQVKIVLIIN